MAEAKTAAAGARQIAPTVVPPPDPRVVGAATRLGEFYNDLIVRHPQASDLAFLPGELRNGKSEAVIGVGSTVGRTLEYALALIKIYGWGVVGARDEASARAVLQGWVDDYNRASAERRPDEDSPGRHIQYHPVDTKAFRADFDLVIGAIDSVGPGVVDALLVELGGMLAALREAITSSWAATINRAVAPWRAQLLETVLTAKHMREDPYEVYRFRGATGRAEFGPVVVKIGDPLLSTLYEHPDGIDILRALARSSESGELTGKSVVKSAEDSLTAFRAGLLGDVHWRCPEFRPAVLERLGLAKIPGLPEYLTAIGGGFVTKSLGERIVEIAGWALMALSLGFTGVTAAVVLGAAGVVVAGVGLGIAFLRDRDRVRGAEAYAFSHGEKRLIEPQFPVGTAIAFAALLLSAVIYAVQMRGLRLPNAPLPPRPSVPPPRPGAPSAPVRPPAPASSPTAPAAKATDPASRLTGRANQGTGAKLGGAAPRPPETPPPLPPPKAAPAPAPGPQPPPPPAPASPPTPPQQPPPLPPRSMTPPPAPRPAASDLAPPPRPSGAPRTAPESAPSSSQRAAPRVPPAQRGIPPDDEQLARDAIRALENELAQPNVRAELAAARDRIVGLLEALEQVPANAELVRKLEVAAGALENPELYAELVVAIRRELDAIRNAGVPVAAWEEARWLTSDELRAAARVVGLTEQTADDWLVIGGQLDDADFLPTVAANRVGFVDLAFKGDDHGILTHALQDWIMTKALAELNLGTAAELRALLVNAVAPPGWVSRRGLAIGADIWGELTDSLGTAAAPPGEQGMYSPEFLTRRLMQFFPGITKPPKFPGSPPSPPRDAE